MDKTTKFLYNLEQQVKEASSHHREQNRIVKRNTKAYKDTIGRLLDKGSALVDQLDKGVYKDEHGHDIRNNVQFQLFKHFIDTMTPKEEDIDE